MEGQQGVENRQGALIHAQPSLRRADIPKEIPFVDRLGGRPFLRERLICHMGKSQRSPPKGRRGDVRNHVPLPVVRQKNAARQNDTAFDVTLDSDSRKWDSQPTTEEKGFRISFWGPFSFAAKMLVTAASGGSFRLKLAIKLRKLRGDKLAERPRLGDVYDD